jgi:hypothetical protein
MEKRLELKENSRENLGQNKLVKKMREDLFGNARIESLPFDLQAEFTRSNLNVAPHIWDNYDVEIQGRAIAVEVIKGHIKTLDRFEGILKANREHGRKSKQDGRSNAKI